MAATPIAELVTLARRFTEQEWRHAAAIAVDDQVETACFQLAALRARDEHVPPTERRADPVLHAAAYVAASPPLRQAAHVHRAGVHWSRITQLRDRLEERGLEWRNYR